MSSPVRILFFGTSEFAVPALRSVASRADIDVMAVYTQPDRPAGRGRKVRSTPVAEAARALGLSLEQPERLRAEAVSRLREYRPDAVVLAAYGLIVPRAALEIPTFGWLNLHPSLLPRHRGASPVAAAILSGDDETGLSIFLMGPGVDDGPVLRQWKTAVEPEETTEELTGRMAELGARVAPGVLREWVKGEIVPQAQDDARATYSEKLSTEDAVVDWRLSAAQIHRRVRAFRPWPVARTTWKGSTLRILRAALSADIPGGGAGTVGHDARTGMPVVRCGEGALLLTELQLPGGKPLDGRAFLAGHRDLVGSELGA